MKERLYRWLAVVDTWATRIFNPVMNVFYMAKYHVTGTKLQELERALTTPEAIADWVVANVRYVMDPVSGLLNNVQRPEVTLARGTGDCDDSAYLCMYLLRQRGYETWLLTLFTEDVKSSHTICVFRDGDGFHHIGNWGLYRVGAPSIPALAETVFADQVWQAGRLQAWDLNRGVVFTRATMEVAVAQMEPEKL